jgi:hypothetical protein
MRDNKVSQIILFLLSLTVYWHKAEIIIGKRSLDNGYLDNFDNESSNTYKKILKI